MLLEGKQLARYHLIRLLKRGGMSDVYLAHDPQLGRQVAIKVIQTDLFSAADCEGVQEAIRLFLREARTIAQLTHPNILQVYDCGEEDVSGCPFMYMVTPFYAEGSLADWLRERDKGLLLLPREVAHIVRQAASALQYAHENDIIHQDIKPSNFLLDGAAKSADELSLRLADFGLARLLTTTTESLSIRGTPMYMAPELWQGRPDFASDQYALAVMAYELLTGRPPFIGSSYHQLMRMHCSTPPTPPCAINTRLHPDFDAVLLRALQKEPEERYPTIADFARAFSRAIHTSGNIIPINPTGDVVALPTMAPLPPTMQAYMGRQDREPAPKTGLARKLALFVLACMLLVGGVGSAISNLSRNAPPATSLSLNGATSATQTASARANHAVTAATSARETSVAHTNNSATATAVGSVVAATNATATAQAAGGTSTAIAEGSLTATATAEAKATGIAIIGATATAYTTATQIGPPAFEDSLTNSNDNIWDSFSNDGSSCLFQGSSYQASIAQSGYISPCFAQTSNFSDFSYQIKMTISKGDQGGVIFRADMQAGNFYYFAIDSHGNYALVLYSGYNPTNKLSSGYSAAIHTGLNQPNLIDVTAIGNTFTLYVNRQRIAIIVDDANTYSQGQIGVIAESVNNPTDVAFNDAEVW